MKNATIRLLSFIVRNRHNSYSHRARSTPSGGSASRAATSRWIGVTVSEPSGRVKWLWSALRCSCSWKGESSCSRVRLNSLSYSLNRSIGLTCASGINGGPAAISNALLPDLTRRVTPESSPCSSFDARLNCPALSSEPGPNWTSVSGGGLGSRGEVAAAICTG